MGKFTTMLVLLVGALIIFNVFGLVDGGASGSLYSIINDPSVLQSRVDSGIDNPVKEDRNAGLFVLLGSAVGSIIIAITALVTRSYSPEIILLAAAVPALFAIVFDLFIVFNNVNQVSHVLAIILLSPVIILWIFTVIEWWSGVST